MVALDNLDKKLEESSNYDNYIRFIREYVNGDFRSASYLAVGREYSTTISKSSILPLQYLPFYKNFIEEIRFSGDLTEVLEKHPEKILMVFHTKTEKEIIYEKDILKGRNDIYLSSLQNRTKLPESTILTKTSAQDGNTQDEREKKLSELRYYVELPNIYLEKNIKKIEKNHTGPIYIPTIFAVHLLLSFEQYFPKILYISKPYYQENPFASTPFYGCGGPYEIVKKPISISENYLSHLTLLSIVRHPTFEPYILGLSYKFELDKEAINKIKIEEKIDNIIGKATEFIDKTLKSIINMKFVPSDVGPYQITFNGREPIFIDIAPGFGVAINQGGLKALVENAYNELLDADKFEILKRCEIKDNYIVCKDNIFNTKTPYNLGEKIKNGIDIKGYMDMVDSLDEDEFEKITSNILKIHKLYAKEYKQF
ncbi:hypothetical protein MJ1_0493 [Nanobdella aerobiophila]|uniref:Uncharacterized protein n=1 Tax=Nanobdella aerobiophila TaxID=2586965 RepID=A0A915SIH8_9ARCH|nr:hypothetical protein [Nanobdella aerobiophila]BBL45647.1 hypothetical protein MJ1_0493 [Nanobdella aerobiophila]